MAGIPVGFIEEIAIEHIIDARHTGSNNGITRDVDCRTTHVNQTVNTHKH